MTTRRNNARAAIAPGAWLLIALLAALPAHAADEPADPLGWSEYLLGGEWVAQEKQTDGDGRSFVPVMSFERSLDGHLVKSRLAYLYEDGTRRPNLEGFWMWDPVSQRCVHFAVMASGMTITGECIQVDEKTGRIDFDVSWPDGALSREQPRRWRDVWKREGKDRQVDVSYILRDAKWTEVQRLTWVRKPVDD